MKDSRIGRQIVLPFSKALEISMRSIQVRFGRSLLAASGIILATAFLMNVWTSGTVMKGLVLRAVEDTELRVRLERGGEIDNVQAQQRATWLVGLSLLVCVVGVANAVLMSVTERYREIGTMKCLGALDSFVLKLFLLESMFLGGLGTIIGVLVGSTLGLLGKLISYGAIIFSATPWPELAGRAGIAFVIGTGLSIAGALYPAHRASRMQPVAAMRVTE